MDHIVGTGFEIFQYGSLILASGVLFFTIKRSLINKQWYFDFPMILLMLHGIIYYLFLFSVRFDMIPTPQDLFFTPWSTALRFHGCATLFIVAVTNYIRERRKKKLWNY